MPSHDSSRFDAVAATHAQRDAEESARLRQLGALVVHDLNNALFALVGRAQLLRRSIHDPVVGNVTESLVQALRTSNTKTWPALWSGYQVFGTTWTIGVKGVY